MRLSQIARKVGVTQSTIVELLQNNGFNTPERGNVKLNEEQVSMIYKHFGIIVFTEPAVIKELEKENIKDKAKDKELAEAPDQAVETTKVEEENPTEPLAQPLKNLTEDSQGTTQPMPEVIRAKKVKLEGIKILGKIDLPEPKAKAEKKKEETNPERQPRHKSPRHKSQRRDHQKGRRKKTPLTFEQKQALEERKLRREKSERETKLKKKKREYFEQKIKPKQQEVADAVQRKRKKKESLAQNEPIGKRTKLTTKNPFKRFWQWLNDPYA